MEVLSTTDYIIIIAVSITVIMGIMHAFYNLGYRGKKGLPNKRPIPRPREKPNEHENLRQLCVFQYWLGSNYTTLPTDSTERTNRAVKYTKEKNKS